MHPSPSTKPIPAADLIVSVVALLATVVFGAVSARVALYLLLVLDACPNLTCNVGRATTVVGVDLVIALVIGIVGFAVTIVKLVRRRRAWPYAVGTFVLCVVACLVGVLGYFAAAGA
ncbi:hypothetical protein [Mycolicibacterium sp.]|uniref:hypothetical protein n=1 Tax=Mycolicibacterium sp. TaxID=2320850 RepID=UPI001A1E51D3|nr:hypothetical protein [Mycolicibacterium sp.]MBJ7339150.1 hypothetical protein [Mycolicibacterium sp.]